MKGPSQAVAALCFGLLVAACGGEEAPPPGTPAGEQPPLTTTGQEAAPAGEAAPQAAQPELVREVFSYRGSGRDPFLSLIRTGGVRPLFEDLRVTSINYDGRYPSNSVAVLRDTTVNKRYTVRIGDELGRLRVVEIRPREVIVIMEEFGVERQRSLQLRRRQEGTP